MQIACLAASILLVRTSDPYREASLAFMRYQKIHMLGGPGSGKSFAASKIAAAYALPIVHLDDLFWERRVDRVKAPEGERDLAFSRILERESWIVEGVYFRWVSRSFEEADKIIVLVPSVWKRDWRILRRFLKLNSGLNFLKKAPLWYFVRLLAWNHRYERDDFQQALAALAHLHDKVVECRTLDEVFRALET
jgi:adenylate kinase family enzyme